MSKSDLIGLEEKNKMIQTEDNKYKIFVHLTTNSKNKGSGLVKVIEDLKLYSQENPQAKFIVGCDQKNINQEERAKKIIDEIGKDKCSFAPYNGPFKLSKILSEVDLVITDKLHVGIVSVRLGKKVISVSYHTKTARFYNQIQKGKWSILLKDLKNHEVLERLKNIENESNPQIENIVSESQNNKKLVDLFINTKVTNKK